MSKNTPLLTETERCLTDSLLKSIVQENVMIGKTILNIMITSVIIQKIKHGSGVLKYLVLSVVSCFYQTLNSNFVVQMRAL